MIITVGISGTRHGANPKQLDKIKAILKSYKRRGAEKFRHGDCIGVDVEAAEIARELGYSIISHPGPLGVGSISDFTMERLPFLDRNKVIVRMSDVMLIVPHTNTEVLRSGTWATYRYAKKRNVLIRIITR